MARTENDALHEAHVEFMERQGQTEWLTGILEKYDRMCVTGTTEWPEERQIVPGPSGGLKSVPVKRRGR